MSENRGITRSAGTLGIATLFSRIGGLVRDMVIAGLFGAGFATDAFFVAFTLPNLLRRFFAEGSLTAAFVPVFSQVYHRDGEEGAKPLADRCWTLLTLVMVVVVLLGIFFSPYLVQLIGYGFADTPGKLHLTDQLNRVMFPYLFFVSLLALATGILNVRGRYFVPAVSPLVLNLAIIACALFLGSRFDQPIFALAWGVVLGGLLQLVMQVPGLRRIGFLPRPRLGLRHPDVSKISRLMLPGIAGVAIYQINVIVTRLLASFLPEGSVSYLYYGQRLFEFPQGIIVASLAQALLPTLSRQAADNQGDAFRDSLRHSMSLLLLILLPATIGMVLCAKPIYSLFFMRGAFDAEAVRQTSYALAAYAPGLLFVGISRLVVPTFYAMQDTRTPVLVSFWTLLVNVGFGLLLMGPFQHIGLAFALTLSALFNAAVLLVLLRRRFPDVSLGVVWNGVWRLLPGLAGMLVVVKLLLAQCDWSVAGESWVKGGWLAAAVVGGGVSYLLICRGCRVPNLDVIGDLLLRRRLPKGKSL